MRIKKYQDLIVWQKSMQLVRIIYLLVKKLPKEEVYSLSDQMRRAAVSIPSNIAEGYERNSTKEYIQFLSVANGSKAELLTQILICIDIGYLTEKEVNESIELIDEISKMLAVLIRKLTPNS